MKKIDRKEIKYNINNIYNEEKISIDELKLIFNKKFLKMIFKLEKEKLDEDDK